MTLFGWYLLAGALWSAYVFAVTRPWEQHRDRDRAWRGGYLVGGVVFIGVFWLPLLMHWAANRTRR